MLYIASTFSLNMLPLDRPGLLATIKAEAVTVNDARHIVNNAGGYESIIGHSNIAAIASTQLGIDAIYRRVSVQLQAGDRVLVAQYFGPRLAEGATTLPPDARICYVLVMI